tara:strand:+ start:31 stop:819 length:789 start_codon:yes stop_codon:yes gene_type:complete
VFYDAHNHFQAECYSSDRAGFLAQCEDLARMVVNGCAEPDWPTVAQMAEDHPQILPSFGYHPWFIHLRTPDWKKILEGFLDQYPSAVGEIGIDRWKKDISYDDQEEIFLTQLAIATERNLPVSIHCLKAWGRLLELLQENPVPKRGFLLHSYGGSAEMIPAFAKLGAYYSFPGYFLRESKGRLREAFKEVPIDRLLIETDAPDMQPPDELNEHPLEDKEGKSVNHPANIGVVYRKLAKFLKEPEDQLAKRVEENFLRYFERL